jgi:hypothetical protein
VDQLQTRLEALEHRTHTVERQLRWWRGLACGLAVLGLLGWGLPLGLAREDAAEKDKDQKGLAQRVAALEELLKHFSREKNEIFLTGANLHIVNGLGSTDCFDDEGNEIANCPNGLGNLIVGYNEPRPPETTPNIRTGSHNVVVGSLHNFSSFGGLVVGLANEISGIFSSVSGGNSNIASGRWSSISGGGGNTASGDSASVSGGNANTASGPASSISGGSENSASGLASSISAGLRNIASNEHAWVSGGAVNTASGLFSSISGGSDNTASGLFSSISGGNANIASGDTAAVSGGRNITQATEFGWSAGSEADEVVVGNVRSP